jgi:hypothetical protein
MQKLFFQISQQNHQKFNKSKTQPIYPSPTYQHFSQSAHLILYPKNLSNLQTIQNTIKSPQISTKYYQNHIYQYPKFTLTIKPKTTPKYLNFYSTRWGHPNHFSSHQGSRLTNQIPHGHGTTTYFYTTPTVWHPNHILFEHGGGTPTIFHSSTGVAPQTFYIRDRGWESQI